jgi:hypothetical protein
VGPGGAPRPTPFWRSRGFWIYLLVLLALNYLITFVFMSGPSRITVPYTTFITQLNTDNVKDITAQSNSIQGDFKKSVTYGSASGTLFQTERPARHGWIATAQYPAELRASAFAHWRLSLPEPADDGGGSGRHSRRLRPEPGHVVYG